MRYIIGFLYFIICAIVARTLMKKKGYQEEANTWFWMGLLFGVFALIFVLLKPKKETHQDKE